MSQPEEPVPSPLDPTPPGPVVPAPAREAGGVEAGSPYRVPAPPVESSERELHAGPAPRRPRPLLGPTLSVFAVLLWTFVMAGQFTTSWLLGAPLGQGLALVLVVLTTFVAWFGSVRRSRAAAPPRKVTHLVWRGIGIAALAWLLFVICLVVATAVGAASSRNHDMLIAVVLVVVSMVAAIGGPRLTSPTPPQRTHGQRFALVALWIGGALVTLVAAADLATNG